MFRRQLIGVLAAGFVSSCTSAEMALFAEALAEAEYDSRTQYYTPQSTYYAPPVSSPYTPYTFNTYGGWPSGVSYGDWVGYGECRYIGSFYTCDTDGDGYADMYGDTDDGSFSSSHLRVNGVGEAYTWGSDCSCWQREPAYDNERAYRGRHHRRDRYDDDDYHYDDD